jgi:hypothetical protein
MKPAEKPPTTPGRLNNPPSEPPVGWATCGSNALPVSAKSPVAPPPEKLSPIMSLPRTVVLNGNDMNRARLPPNFHSLFSRASAASAEMNRLIVSAVNIANDRNQDSRNDGVAVAAKA